MSKQLTVDDFQQSLNAHVTAKGEEIREKYGPNIGWNELHQILEDRSAVRYPCQIHFDSSQLLDGELAHPLAIGDRPEDGFKIYVHPFFASRSDRVVCIVLYQLVLVNYGAFASSDDAESFGSKVLGIPKEDYYQTICAMADELTT